MSKQKRTESEYAAQRKIIRLPELKCVDLIKTGDLFEFVYRGVSYKAKLTCESELQPVLPLSQMTRATKTAQNTLIYQMPSNFTLDCVDSYWYDNNKQADDAAKTCKTNPSGYERVRHVTLNKSLNDLRDEYMRIYPNGRIVKTPNEVTKTIIDKTTFRTKRKQANGTSIPLQMPQPPQQSQQVPPTSAASEAAKLVETEAITVATIRAEGISKGYKAIAERLETSLGRMSRTLASYEEIIERCVEEADAVGFDGPAIREARDVVETFRQQSASIQLVNLSSPARTSSSSSTDSYGTMQKMAQNPPVNLADLITSSLASM